MPKNKITTILSETDKFFDKKDASSTMFNIMRTINSLRLSEKVLFGRVSKCNQVYSLLSVFVCLLISCAAGTSRQMSLSQESAAGCSSYGTPCTATSEIIANK